MQNALQILNRLKSMKDEANQLENLVNSGHPLYGDVLVLRSQIDGMADAIGDISNEASANLPSQSKLSKSVNDFKVGDRVRLVSINMRPMYLRGAEGSIVGHGSKKLKVKLDENTAYRKFSGVVTTAPVSIVEKL